MKSWSGRILFIVTVLLAATSANAAIIGHDVTSEWIQAKNKIGPGSGNPEVVDTDHNVPFPSFGTVRAFRQVSQTRFYDQVHNYNISVIGNPAAADSLVLDSTFISLARLGGSGASANIEGRVAFGVTAPTRYVITGGATYLTGPTTTRTRAHLRNTGNNIFSYRYGNTTTPGALGMIRTLGDGGGPGGTETGLLTGLLAPGFYEFFWSFGTGKGTGQVDSDFNGEMHLSLITIPLPGALLLFAPGALMLVVYGKRRIRTSG